MTYAGNGLYEFEVNGQKVLLSFDDLKCMIDRVVKAEAETTHSQGELNF